jgi:hypothetical protein
VFVFKTLTEYDLSRKVLLSLSTKYLTGKCYLLETTVGSHLLLFRVAGGCYLFMLFRIQIYSDCT